VKKMKRDEAAAKEATKVLEDKVAALEVRRRMSWHVTLDETLPRGSGLTAQKWAAHTQAQVASGGGGGGDGDGGGAAEAAQKEAHWQAAMEAMAEERGVLKAELTKATVALEEATGKVDALTVRTTLCSHHADPPSAPPLLVVKGCVQGRPHDHRRLL
jgi:hypothetical protein